MFSGIENYYERLVFARIRLWRQEQDDAVDADLLEDLACVALNRLPPRYYRHSVDLASHLSLNDRVALDKEVNEAVLFAVNLVHNRRGQRQEEG